MEVGVCVLCTQKKGLCAKGRRGWLGKKLT